MARHHLIQISDLHLSEERSYNQAGWEACLNHIEVVRPEFVAITGDLVLDDPDHERDHLFARRQLDRLSNAWATLPGNHDVGDTNPSPYMGQHFDDARLFRYRATWGADYWARELGNWVIIGLNAFLPGSGLAAESEQEDWLRQAIRSHEIRPTALFLHKPLCLDRIEEESLPDICVIAPGRDRLLSILRQANLRLVASGHNHHYRTLAVGRTQIVWAPSTAQILHMPRPFTALLKPGLVNYWLDDDGSLEFGLIEPAGMVATDITDLIARHRAMRVAPLLPWRA